MQRPAVLVLEDGTVFRGESIGADGQSVGEVVFNTAITGYQEILTDPSYARQIVTLTYPHIGNVGTNPEDAESPAVHAAGLVIRDLPPALSSWRSDAPLSDYLAARGVVAIAGIDTRRLTRILREKGAQNGCLLAAAQPDPAAPAAYWSVDAASALHQDGVDAVPTCGAKRPDAAHPVHPLDEHLQGPQGLGLRKQGEQWTGARTT